MSYLKSFTTCKIEIFDTFSTRYPLPFTNPDLAKVRSCPLKKFHWQNPGSEQAFTSGSASSSPAELSLAFIIGYIAQDSNKHSLNCWVFVIIMGNFANFWKHTGNFLPKIVPQTHYFPGSSPMPLLFQVLRNKTKIHGYLPLNYSWRIFVSAIFKCWCFWQLLQWYKSNIRRFAIFKFCGVVFLKKVPFL